MPAGIRSQVDRMLIKLFLLSAILHFVVSGSVQRDTAYRNKNEKHTSGEDADSRMRRSAFNMRNAFMIEVLKQSSPLEIISVNEQGKLVFTKDEYAEPETIKKEYDFIIVGAGAAGCVLANRLTERGDWTVLLLEAGEAENIITKIPMMAAIGESSEYAWNYPVEPNPNACLAMDNKTCRFAVGKGVGGGTIINYMIYSRGIRRDYDKMAEAGNAGWSYDEVLPYFIKSENANLQDIGSSTDHGKNGLLSVEDPNERTKYEKAFIEGAKELKQNTGDYNNGQPGFGYAQFNMRNGRRHSAARAFLFPIRDRKNLHILQKSRVTRIHISKQSKKAKSLEYVRNRKRYKVRARKEIILSAGAHNSPKLLMLSGVGPKDHLKELNIPLVKDLKVGETLYEHVAYTGLSFTVDEPDVNEADEFLRLSTSIFQWLRDGSGALASVIGIGAIGFINTNTSNDHINSSDIELVIVTQAFTNEATSATFGLRPEIYKEYYSSIRTKRLFTMVPILLNTKSKGHMKLKDKNPFHYPRFYKNMLEDERDLDTLVAGIRFAIKLSKTEAFKKLGTRLHKAHFPLCKEYAYDSDDYWKCCLKSMAIDFRHQVATCMMGPDSNPDAVVDPELRVRGIKNLRVVDAGVFPFPLAAHTTAPVYMLAEKAADLIKNSWKET